MDELLHLRRLCEVKLGEPTTDHISPKTLPVWQEEVDSVSIAVNGRYITCLFVNIHLNSLTLLNTHFYKAGNMSIFDGAARKVMILDE